MMVWWLKLVDSKLNNKILLCLTATNKFIIVFQFYNTKGCPLQKLVNSQVSIVVQFNHHEQYVWF